MKNDAPKPIRIVLLDSVGKSIVGKNCTWETCDHGAAGFALRGSASVMYWADEGKTWKRAEVSL